jgi:hypothetical protein
MAPEGTSVKDRVVIGYNVAAALVPKDVKEAWNKGDYLKAADLKLGVSELVGLVNKHGDDFKGLAKEIAGGVIHTVEDAVRAADYISKNPQLVGLATTAAGSEVVQREVYGALTSVPVAENGAAGLAQVATEGVLDGKYAALAPSAMGPVRGTFVLPTPPLPEPAPR